MAFKRSSLQPSNVTEKVVVKTPPWKSNIPSPLCASCNKSVFPAEELMAAGQKFHKFCLKCSQYPFSFPCSFTIDGSVVASCNTMLNPGNINVHETKIYCVPCHRRQFGPRGLGRGLANCYVEAIETPPSSPSLSRDEPDSYDHLNHPVNHRHEEKNSAESSPPSRTSSEDSGVFLGALKSRQVVTNSSPSRPVTSSLPNAAAFRMVSAPANVCPRCSKTVYSAEEVKAVGRSFHKRCYTCAKCKGSISAGRYSEHEGELYDNSKRPMKQMSRIMSPFTRVLDCYQRLFGPRGVGFGIGAGALSTGN